MLRDATAIVDDKSQVPGANADQYHLMMIEPKSMKFDLHTIGQQLPRFAPGKDGKSLLVAASVVVVRNEASASISIDPSGKITAEVKGAFGDTSGSLFGVFDLQTKTYVPFALVLRIRLELDAKRHAREEFCLSTDARSCDASILYRSRLPQARD